MTDDDTRDDARPARPNKLSFRVNGTRVGSVTRPARSSLVTAAGAAATTRLATRRAALRITASALSTRPNDYMPDDDGGEVAS